MVCGPPSHSNFARCCTRGRADHKFGVAPSTPNSKTANVILRRSDHRRSIFGTPLARGNNRGVPKGDDSLTGWRRRRAEERTAAYQVASSVPGPLSDQTWHLPRHDRPRPTLISIRHLALQYVVENGFSVHCPNRGIFPICFEHRFADPYSAPVHRFGPRERCRMPLLRVHRPQQEAE